MDSLATLYGHWALIAGGAAGMGAAFSEQLARRGFHLLLIDIDSDALDLNALKLRKEFGVSVKTLLLDLADPQAPDQCMELVSEVGCRLMVYVAAYSKIGPFLSISGEDMNRHLAVNAVTPIHLVSRFARRLQVDHQKGGIILISSLAGMLGPPLVAPYAATKGFLIRLAESLSSEFKSHGIDISVCCAGITHTPTYVANTPEKARKSVSAMDPRDVAETALVNLGKRVVCVAGGKNRMIVWLLIRILPRRTAQWIMNSQMQRMYRSEKTGEPLV